MSKMRLKVLVVLAWVVVSPAQGDGGALSFGTTVYRASPTAEADVSSERAEWSRTCTYQGGPKSGNWVCR